MQLTQITDFLGFTNTPEKEKIKDNYEFSPAKLGEKIVYLEWEAYSRPQGRFFNKRLIRTLTIIGIVVGLLLAMMLEFMIIILVASVIFVSYALSKSSPEKIKYQISSYGIMSGDTMYYWPQLKTFFFTTYDEMPLLAVDTTLGLPARIFLTLEEKDKQLIKETLDKHLVFLTQEPKTQLDKAYEKLMSKFNFIEEESK